MITIEEQTLRELILRTEPGFLTQSELKENGFGNTMKFKEKDDSEDIWIWSKERVRSASRADLNYLVNKIIE